MRLKRVERIIYEKVFEELEELRSKFKRRIEEGYYEVIIVVEFKFRKKDEFYEEFLRKIKEEFFYWIKELIEEEKKVFVEEGKIIILIFKFDKIELSFSMEVFKIFERI